MQTPELFLISVDIYVFSGNSSAAYVYNAIQKQLQSKSSRHFKPSLVIYYSRCYEDKYKKISVVGYIGEFDGRKNIG